MSKLSIIVPCFNEEKAITLFYDEIIKTIDSLNTEYELVFVNDGSKDHTLQVIKEISQKDSNVIYLSFSRNFGKEAAMLAGFKTITGDYVAVMDADLQDPPALLPEMISILNKGEYDSVATRRSDREGEPMIRSWFAERFYHLINRFSDTEIVSGARDYRLMKREMVDAIVAMSEYNRFSKGIYGWVGFRTYWLSYKNIERVAGETKWSFWKLFRYAIDGIVSFSLAPLNIASWLGIIMTVVSLIALIFIIIRKLLLGDPVAGWASTICVIVFVGGIQMAILGIIGQYLAKTYMETKERPHYIVSDSNRDDIVKIG